MSETGATPGGGSVDAREVEHFARLAEEWWDPNGKFRPIHKFNPVRLDYIRDHSVRHFGRDARRIRSLDGLSIVDIGCGGGLLSEPLARLGAEVTGVDPSETNVATAALHAEEAGVEVTYRATTAEALAAEGARFDVVVLMEVVEHVSDVPGFLAACAGLVKPGGLLFAATINRTAKAFAMAIVGAEYVLGWLPRGTHTYSKLVRPEELARELELSGLTVTDRSGVVYNPLADAWHLSSRDLDVNYMLVAERAAN
ncbi:bifunctional 2-polyprenyl-6-hydroxyphenol methylase/3-demethylubiquinol 3-O-methyltransferase UbiG [Lutibaculum baratangense]|uniref:Ubiquinone biosynthesis O-methyltransferase n=1 Tax=Lutibaculum baratangense AMV1 TaxID=631454 RepID=V4TCQ5_9HYPH|nr:bifunctional 2-polyprenyl-6-hydroxyphenol methylase/3-demethylubiquinol 3-O-methyltransferase UbiG [Lutibaculum baratangense]ESR24083.1 3-demethylubiquinone-9 3-methyltransferase [Lutibaculum baratangense AMV1]